VNIDVQTIGTQVGTWSRKHSGDKASML
jgi:hypothetical protein